MKTSACVRLGIDLPIVQAPMGAATNPVLAAAVSNAGGLGTVALSWGSPDEVRKIIRETRALTDRPFGVNFILDFPQEERLAVCLEEKVPAISFFWGDPEPHIAACHAAGAAVLYTVASADQARRGVDAGVDVVVAQGWEAGGHVLGEVATLPLVRAVVDAVAPVPVLAAGGIADGRGLAAVLALGAAGAWIGTRFLATPEADVHPHWRARLLAASETETVHTGLFDIGWPDAPHRVLRNITVNAWEAAGRPPSGSRPGEGEVIATTSFGPSPRYMSTIADAGATGDIESLSLWSGQGVAQVHRVQPAAEVVREIAEEARTILKALAAEVV